MRACPNCGNQVSEKAVFCDQCGNRLSQPEPVIQEAVAEQPGAVAPASSGVPEGVILCPSCGAENVPGEVFCDVCGEPLQTPTPIAEVEAAAIEEAVIEEAAIEEAVIEETVVEEPVAEVVVEEVVAEETVIAEEAPAGIVGAPAGGGAAFCPVCGSSVNAGDTYCGSCGSALSPAAIEEAVEEQPISEEPAFEPIVEEPAVAVAPVVEAAPVEAVTAVEMTPVVAPEIVAEPEAVAVPETIVVASPVAPSAVSAAVSTCPACGASVQPGQVFCGSCGASLQAAPQPVVEVVPEVVPAGPYLEVVESGAHILLVVQPELLVGRLDESSGIEPEVDVTPHGGLDKGVSRRHAKLLHEGSAWFVFDLDSTNGTQVNGKEVTPKTRTSVQDGDKIAFGELEMIFHAG